MLNSFEHETNGTVLHLPLSIMHRSWDEIDPVCQGLCPEGQNQNEGTFLKNHFCNVGTMLVLFLQEIFVVVNI